MPLCYGLLLACSGSTGPQGATGATGATGPQGPTGAGGSISAIDISNAQSLTATITSVSVPSSGAIQPVVKFQLVNETGLPVKGLTANEVSFGIAKLVPAHTQLKPVPPQTTAPAPQNSSQWQSYIYHSVAPAPASAGTPANPVVGTTSQPQATIEPGSQGTFVDNGDGTYQYTFKKDIGADSAVTYDATLTHRVGFEIRGTAPANSPIYTFQPSSGATTNITTRAIVDDQICWQCHNTLGAHGGARTDAGYCVVCHNPSSIDPSSGNSLDFKIMFHKIHMGENLPSVKAGGAYYIFGYMNSISDFSTVAYPQADASNNNAAVSGSGQRFCVQCHNSKNTDTPDTGNYASVPSSQACGSCHDDVNFATGQNHSAANISAQDSDCLTCHGPSSTISNGNLQVAKVHQSPVDSAAQKFAFNVVSVSNAQAGQTPAVTIKVTDPTNNNAPYDITQAGGPFTTAGARLTVDLGWNTTDFNNIGTNSATATSGSPNLPITINFTKGVTNNGDGTFTKAAAAPIPAAATGTGEAFLEGHPIVPLTARDGSTSNISLGVKAASQTFLLTDSSAQSRRQVVSVSKCQVCHRTLTLHGQSRTNNIELCTACHNPNATDIIAHGAASGTCAASTATTSDVPIDFKVLIHKIHNSGNNPFTICGFGSNPVTFNVGYPGDLNDCEACHNSGTYYPVDSTVVQGTTIHAGADRTTLTDDTVVSPNAAVCSTCHTDTTAQQHMVQNGGDFNAKKSATGALISSGTETCSVCHGQGTVADVYVKHAIASENNINFGN